ncbi:spore coat U domain-containing protein [Achromobacter sp. Marseille-Q0513]|uniref:Csu type fimbrial protein n=1 Tax=Achromobacter sp. Marseille-Q0513 TaxID=2829161 RepID=UPI001B92F353|nr:spore coat U domain-containing protein [Achromobacter sp. Marseille-Q0513]MBR8657634.1 spore coat U domain-containing protein [Achromobacter sp. Marseille-Q0513]
MKRAIALVVIALGWAGAAQAQTCNLTGSSTTIDFGVVNPLLPANTLNNGGLIKVTCSGLFLATRICISLETGNTSPSIAGRAMGNGAYRMNYNLYTDSGYSNVWGDATTSPPTSQVINVFGSGSISVPIFAKLPGGQISVSTVGNADTQYLEIYSGTSARVDVDTGLFFPDAINCPLSFPGATLNIPLTVKALVQKNCTISATNLVFPAQGLLTTAVPGSSQISVQCTNNNAYSLALNGGAVGGNVLARKMKHSTAADTVSYQLYQAGDYAVIWGDASGGSPKAGVGSGAVQNHTVYGRVPAQATPRPGSYSDTVTATITF